MHTCRAAAKGLGSGRASHQPGTPAGAGARRRACRASSGRRVNLMLAGAVVSAGCALWLGGCVQEPAPFDPRQMQMWERAADTEVKPQPLYPLPATQESRFVPGETRARPVPLDREPNVPEGPAIPMTLQEIIHRAIVNSYDIRVAAYDTAVDQTRVMEAEAHFDPTLFADFQFQDVDKQTGYTDATIPTAAAVTALSNGKTPSPSDFTSEVVNFDKENISTFQYGVRQNTQAGGQLELKEQVTNSYFNPARTFTNPYYDNELILSITQPILQNFGVAVNNARVTIAQNNQRVSLLDFRKTVEETVLNLEKAYWQLVQADADVKTIERLVAASEDTTGVLFRRQSTDVSAVQIQQSNAATATRRAELAAALAHVADLSDQIKQLMNDPEYPVASSGIITPATGASDIAMHFNLDEQIETALANRYDLGQQQVRIASSEVAVDVARNNLLPQLNLQGQVTVDGISNNLADAFNSQNNFNHVGFVAGFQFELPLGNRAARAIWERALDQRQQAIDAYGRNIELVATDVKTAARAIDTAWEQLKARRNARFYNEHLLADFQRQQDAGNVPLTYDYVNLRLQYQEQLASAEQAEHQALNDYNFAIATLQKNTGTILRYDNVILEEQESPLPFQNDANKYSGLSGR
jgi:outer membrane protein